MISSSVNGFYLYENCIDYALEKRLINIINTDNRFTRFIKKTNKLIGYPMGANDYPEDWELLTNIIYSLNDECVNLDYALQLTYLPGVYFRHHYDSKVRWGTHIVGVNLGSEAELYFTKKGEKTIIKKTKIIN